MILIRQTHPRPTRKLINLLIESKLMKLKKLPKIKNKLQNQILVEIRKLPKQTANKMELPTQSFKQINYFLKWQNRQIDQPIDWITNQQSIETPTS